MADWISWGRVHRYPHTVRTPHWMSELTAEMFQDNKRILPGGARRSYGDVCLNRQGLIIDMTGLNRFHEFNLETGIIRADAGATLADVLEISLPRGWFLPVTPGTKWVTLGGAVANDVHGKNHHVAGTFGCHVLQFELMRSDGSKQICSPKENIELFNATIGGLGLTGVITWVELQLIQVVSPLIDAEHIRFQGIDNFNQLAEESDHLFPYTVAWIDCMATGVNAARGIYMRGKHAEDVVSIYEKKLWQVKRNIPSVPIEAPEFLLNQWTLKAFNSLYYHKQREQCLAQRTSFDRFFYPLDVLNGWNKMYGRRGFYQYQMLLPFGAEDALKDALACVAHSEIGSSLAVLKRFGTAKSPGMLSFPRPGYTLTLDFPNKQHLSWDLMRDLTEIVLSAKGRVYPGKDAFIDRVTYQQMFPEWQDFLKFKDPIMSSSFWRRVVGDHA